jgi:hypothetical protein
MAADPTAVRLSTVIALSCLHLGLRTYGNLAVRLGLSALEFSVAVSSLVVLPLFTLPPAVLFVLSLATTAYACLCYWDSAHPSRDASHTHTALAVPTKCKCPCGTCDYRDSHAILPIRGSMLHCPSVDTCNSSPYLSHVHIGDGAGHKMQTVDLEEIALQLISYLTVLALLALSTFAVTFSSSTVDSLARTLFVVAAALVATSTAIQIPINLKTQCAYVSISLSRSHSHSGIPHFFTLSPALFAFILISCVAASTLLPVWDLCAFVLFTGILPLGLCLLSPPVLLSECLSDVPPGLSLIHAFELYSLPWYFFWVSATAAWWTYSLLLQLCGPAFALPLALPPSPLGFDALRLALASVALTLSILLLLDRTFHGLPDLWAIVAAITPPVSTTNQRRVKVAP